MKSSQENTVLTACYKLFYRSFLHKSKYNFSMDFVTIAAGRKSNVQISSAGKIILCLIFIFSSTNLLSQPCSVNIDSLKGQYVGDCKKGKANGTGTATGVDSYTGEFKNGYPDGYGKYTWKNGSWYDGFWKDGLFEGQGTLFKTIDTTKTDSAVVIRGFWKKGKYVGRYKHPYSLTSLTNGINDYSIRKSDDMKSEITIIVRSTSAGGADLSAPVLPKIILADIQMYEGKFEEQKIDESVSNITNTYVLKEVTFPFHAILSFKLPDTNSIKAWTNRIEQVSVTIFENCSYIIQVRIER